MAIRLSPIERLNLISNMGTLLAAGIPLIDAIDSLFEESKGGQKKILVALKEDISQGKKISESFARFPDAFDPVIIHLVRAAEEAGTLDTTLKDLTETIKKEIEFTDKIKSALIYPAMVFVVFLVILVIILTFVIPKIAQVFSQLKVNLPLPTRVMIATSNLLINNPVPFIGGVVLFVALLVIFFKFRRKQIMRALFSLPGLSALAHDIDITRFSRSLSLLLQSGIPIINAMELAEQVVVKKEMYDILHEARAQVAAGQPLSKSFRQKKKVIPAIVIRITQAGEKTGTLAKAMQDLSEYFDMQVSRRVKVLTTLLEPLMLVLMATLIGGMMISIIAPIYSLIGSITVGS